MSTNSSPAVSTPQGGRADAGPHTFTARAVAPIGGAADPDMVLHRAGVVAMSDSAPTAQCTSATPAQCSEAFTQTLSAGA